MANSLNRENKMSAEKNSSTVYDLSLINCLFFVRFDNEQAHASTLEIEGDETQSIYDAIEPLTLWNTSHAVPLPQFWPPSTKFWAPVSPNLGAPRHTYYTYAHTLTYT